MYVLCHAVAPKKVRAQNVSSLGDILSFTFFSQVTFAKRKSFGMASEIARLAALVLTNTVKIDDYLQTNNLPTPSFHQDGPVDLSLPENIEAARLKALDASLRLTDLLRGPVELVRPTVHLETFICHDLNTDGSKLVIRSMQSAWKQFTSTKSTAKYPFMAKSPPWSLPSNVASTSQICVGFFDLPSATIAFSWSLEKA